MFRGKRGISRRFFLAGFSVASCVAAEAAAAPPSAPAVQPAEALARLTAGNARFVSGNLTHGNIAVERRRAFAAYQAPFASVLSCSDSRVPPELIFDQNLGDLFVIRVAGISPMRWAGDDRVRLQRAAREALGRSGPRRLRCD